ncbi:MAG: hypothetical protein Q8Q62_02020, partial [Mesorhizobium sp.]|nr:hypothetical protein [Mesorhizobium sp.]
IDRAQLVYEQFLHELDKPPMKFLFLALQDHFDLPSTGKLDKSLIERVLEQKVTFESPKTRALKHGDWALTLADSNYGACFIKPDLTTISYSGAFLSDAPPQPKFLQFAAGEKPKFSDLYFGDISAFDASKPVVLQVGSQDFKLTADKHGSLVASNTDRAEILKSLAAQEQTVFVKGTSRMGGEVTYSFSTKELPATLDAFSAVCVQNDVPQTYGEWRFKRKPKGSAVAYLPDVKGFSVEVLCAYDDIWVIVEANKKKWPASLLKSKRTTMVMGNKGEPEYYFPDLTLGTQDEVAFFTGLTGNAAKKYADSLMKWDRSLLGFGSDEGILAYVTLPGKGSGKAIKAATDTCAALASK